MWFVMKSRIFFPTCGAASPTPRASRINSNIRLAKAARLSSNFCTSTLTLRSRGSG